jgi:hypothetical protein
LKFIEANWNVSALTTRDANANNFLEAFDFSQTPRQAVFLPASVGSAVLPQKAPAYVIFSTYGLAVLLTLLAIGFAALRMRRAHVTVKE